MPVLQTGIAKSGAAAASYDIDNSVRFDDGDSAFLQKAYASSGNRRTWTFSCWTKRGEIDQQNDGLLSCDFGTRVSSIGFIGTTGVLQMYDHTFSGGSYQTRVASSAVYRDPSAWYHIVVKYDTTEVTDTDRVKLYINGEEITDLSQTTYPAQDYEGNMNYGNGSRLTGIGKQTGTGDYYDGYIAEVYFIDGTALTPSDFGELDSDTNQWIPLDSDDVKDAVIFGINGFYQKYNSTELANSFTDSAEGNVVTVHGNTHTDTAVKKIGTASAQFDGSGDYLSVADGSDFVFGTGNFTLEAWINFSTVQNQGIMLLTDASTSNVPYFQYYGSALQTGVNGVGTINSYSWTPVVDTWYHVAVSRSGSTCKLFIDGTEVDSDSDSTDLTSDGLLIGAWSSRDWDGYMDEIRISNTARYTTSFTPSTSAFTSDGNTKLLLHMDGSNDGTDFPDSSGVTPRHTITASGDATNQRGQPLETKGVNGSAHVIGPKVGTTVATYDGNDYLECADSTDWDFGTGAFCLEAWINMGADATYYDIFSTAAADDNQGIIFYVDGPQGEIKAKIGDGSSWTVQIGSAGGVIQKNTWYHVALAREGTGTNQLRIFLDGVNVAEGTYSDSDADNNTDRFRVGLWSISGWYWNGYIGPVRVSKGAARYTANFTPPTSVWTNDGDTVLLIQDGTDGTQTFDDLSTSDHTIDDYGDVRWLAPKQGSGVLAFDGANDYIKYEDALFKFPGAFTIEYWVRLKSKTKDVMGATYSTSQVVGDWYVHIDGNGHIELTAWNGSSNVVQSQGTSDVADNTWHHVAHVRDSSDTLKLYVDGTEEDSDTNTYGFGVDSTNDMFIGSSYSTDISARSIDGYLNGVRFSKDAKYSGSSITVPTTAFTDSINDICVLNVAQNQGVWFQDISTGFAISTDSRMKFDGSGDYLSTAASSDWDFGTDNFTVEFWANGDPNTTRRESFTLGAGSNNINFDFNESSSPIWVYWGSDGSADASQRITPSGSAGDYTDGAWRHLALVRNGTTVTFYVNGVSVGSQTGYSAALDCSASGVQVGRMTSSGVADWLGYMDEVRISNSARYTTTFTPQTRGNPFTPDINTKLLIHSDYTGGLGADSSGNFNAFTATNLLATDQMIDTPTNNFCTINPIDSNASVTLSEGNLQAYYTTWTTRNNCTIGLPTSGKWYVETCGVTGAHGNFAFGACRQSGSPTWASPAGYVDDNEWGLWGDSGTMTAYVNGSLYKTCAASTGWAGSNAGTVIGIAYDADNNGLWFSRDGVWIDASGGSASSATVLAEVGTSGTTYRVITGSPIGDADMLFSCSPSRSAVTAKIGLNFGQDSSFAGKLTPASNADSNDIGEFQYPVPGGFLALCTDNISTPDIALSGDNFNTVIYTGDDTTPKTIDVGLQPDVTWLKIRSGADTPASHRVWDSLRGSDEVIYPNSDSAESAGTSGYLSGFTSIGPTFTGNGSDVRDVNDSDDNYVIWNWKAGGAPTTDNVAGAGATPTAGSVKIDGANLGSALAGSLAVTRLSANTAAGFSVAKFSGSAADPKSMAHGLSQAPDLIITKQLTDAFNWKVGSSTFTSWSYIMELNSTIAEEEAAGVYNGQAPTSTVWYASTEGGTGASGKDYVTYCFHSVEGYSKVGTYTGNLNADGPFAYTGFSPAFVMRKPLASGSWTMTDNKRIPYNVHDKPLYADNTNSEPGGAGDLIDLVSNGFKVRSADAGANPSAAVMIYIAFAESPFKYSTAR